MASPKALREALGTRLKTISGLHVHDSWPNSMPNIPCAVIDVVSAEPEQTFGRGDLTKWMADIWVMVGLAPGMEQAIDNRDPYLATSSTGGVYGAIHADRTLGGVVSYTFVKSTRDFDAFEIGENISYMGAIVGVEMWAT